MSRTISYDLTGMSLDDAPCLVVWGHGWGMDKGSFKPLSSALYGKAAHLHVDFPGFGASPVPPQEWTTAEYADAVADVVRSLGAGKKIVYVGHSFGGRVGIQLAARHPELVDGLFLIASAGLPRKRGIAKKIWMTCKVYTFKTLKRVAPLFGFSVDALRRKFGSPDYRNAGPLRDLFLKIIREDLSAQAKSIQCPAYILYGANDTETPPEIGQRLAGLIPRSTLCVLEGQDHYSVLGEGRHIVVKRLADFLKGL